LTLHRVKDRDIAGFLRSAAALFQAGFPLDEVLLDCLDNPCQPDTRKGIQNTLTGIRSGEPLSKALNRQRGFISPVIRALIETGESTGTLGSALNQAADMMERRILVRSEIRGALIYPFFMIGVSLAAVIFLSLTVLPQVSRLYAAADVPLPLITEIVVKTGKVCLALLIPGICLALYAWLTPSGKRSLSAIFGRAEKHPFLFRYIAYRRTWLWSEMMSVLIANNIPLTEALDLVAGSFEDRTVETMFNRIGARLKDGLSPGEAFKVEPGIPSLARRLISAGDSAGKLSEALSHVSRYYEAEYTLYSKKLIVAVEPVSILIAGVAVLIIATAVVLPISDLGVLLS
jgi:type II secretory pathway component PulF